MKMLAPTCYPVIFALSGLVVACATEPTGVPPNTAAAKSTPAAEASSVQEVRVILRLKPSPLSPQQILAQIAQAANISAEYVQSTSGGEHVVVLSFPSTKTIEEVLAAVRSQSAVDYVEPDKRRRAR